MRSIYGKVSVALVAALALCVAASASASAAQVYVGGKALTGTEKLAEAVKVEEPIVVYTVKYGAEEAPGKLKCGGAKLPSTATISAAGKITLEHGGTSFTLEKCKFTGPPECELAVQGPEGGNLTTDTLTGTLATGTSPADTMEIASKPSSTWTAFNLSESTSCALGSFVSVLGTTVVKTPKGQTESTEQEFVGEGEASKGLMMAERTAYFTGKFKLKLASGKAWSFH